MPTPILMPALSPTMTEGNLARWLKKVGDPVAPGEPVVELETDKVDLEVGAEQAGVLARIDRQEGEEDHDGPQQHVLRLAESWGVGVHECLLQVWMRRAAKER